MVFGGYFPNPSIAIPEDAISWWYALLAEAWMAALLAFMVFMLTDSNNKSIPQQGVPFFVGFTIASLVGLYESLTVACFNPARDLGPRLVAFLWGWGSVAIPGPKVGFWIYLVGPLIGGPIGGALYQYTLAPMMEASAKGAQEAEGEEEQPLMQNDYQNA